VQARIIRRDKGLQRVIGRALHWGMRGLVWFIVVLIALAVAGAIYQAIATEIDQHSAFPGPGRMVSVDGHRLHLNCTGEGSPTVVLEAGGGYTSVEWSAWIQPKLSDHTRVCAYDRAGMGWSKPSPKPMDATQISGELHVLLQEARVGGPYVLVGHSLGGLYSRVYAERYPEEVAGMVLVDSSHPDQFERLGLESALTANRVAGAVGPPLARIGVFRLFDLFSPGPGLPPLQREQRRSLYYTTPHLVAVFEELGAIPDVLGQARETGTLGRRPLAVVSASDHGADAMTESRAEAARVEREVQILQKDLTAPSSNSTRRVVEGSTHESLVTDRRHARQVGEEILRVVEAVRTERRLEAVGPRAMNGGVSDGTDAHQND
jgi:pimeloyl-ACP methyl ester carboxylesterase